MRCRSFIATGLSLVAVLASLINPSTVSAQASGLVAAYAFNEGAGTTTADVSGNNNNGTLSATAWTTAGKFGGALVFNGTSALVTIPNAASLQLSTGMTLEAWVNPATVSSAWRDVIYKGNDNYYLEGTSDNAGRPGTGGTFNASPLYGTAGLAANTWTHLATTYDRVTLRLYVNGVQVSSVAASGAIATSTNPLQIGGDSLFGQFFQGMIDEVRIYNRALSQAEIQADMAAPVGGTPDTSAPTAPAGLSATAAASGTQIDLAWTASTDNTGVTGYRVERCQGASCASFAQIATPSTTSFSDTGLTGSTSYSYRVRATDAAGNLSAYSNIATATTPVAADITPPSAPSVISAAVVSTSEIDLSWTASTDNVGVTGYQVDRCQGASCTSFAQIATPAATSYNDIGLAAGTTYRYRVRATDAAGNVSANSSIVTATTQAPPDTTPPTAPTGLSATAVSATQVNLAWVASTDNVGVTGYRVERCQGTPCTWVQIGTPTATSFNDTGLTAGTTYSYWVRATDAAGNLSPWSSIVTVTTPNSDTTPPTAPSGLSATAAGSAQINLAWTASTDNVAVTGYLLERCQGAACTLFAQIAAPTVTSFNNAGLAAGTSYSYRVRATDAAGNLSAYSSVASATTSNTPSGLVAAYAFNEGAGTTTADASGNNNNGTIGAATWSTAGKYGNALVFNGTSALVTIPNAASLQLTTGMTLEAWVNPATVNSAWRDVIYKGNDNYYLEGTSENAGRPGTGGTFNAGPLYGTAGLAANTWTHLATTYDGATLRLYENGVQVSSVAASGAIATSTNPLQIGGDSLFGQFFQGMIDEVRIYNRALSQAEIQADMAAPVGGTPPPPDSIPPSVVLTSPAAGSSVTSVVSISANATDNVGVASVQFFLDGAAFGAPVTAPAYAVAWNSPASSLGNHVLTATATDFSGNSATSAPVSVTVVAPSLSTSGQWAAPVTWPFVAVHSNLLWTGQVLASDGQTAGNNAHLWDPATGVFTSVTNSQTNMFCSGHCQLADGRVLVAGGHLGSHNGLTDTNLFNPATSTWTKVAPMNVGRWYPTTTTLPDGRVLVNSGEIDCNGCFAPIPEVYDPQANVWTQLTGASMSFPYYPHVFVLPNGRVLVAATAEDPIVSRVLDIGTQTWSIVDPVAVDGGSSVMYAPGKIMKSGRSVDPDQPVLLSTATTYVLDMNQATPAWRQTGAMAFARTYHTLTLLPDGTVLATGGGPTTDAIGVDGAILAPELWSPVTETWTTLSSMQKPRLYHSGALLMPDARVLVLGGGRFNSVSEPTDQLSSEFLSPPYLFKGPRPTITSAPATGTYGGIIAIQTPDAASIGSVSIVKLGSVTHAFNQNQLIVQLPFTAFSGGINVQAPANANIATPGYYMLFILNTSGVPSVAAMVRIQ